MFKMYTVNQVGKRGVVRVWAVEGLRTLSVLQGQHEGGVCALHFSGGWVGEKRSGGGGERRSGGGEGEGVSRLGGRVRWVKM